MFQHQIDGRWTSTLKIFKKTANKVNTTNKQKKQTNKQTYLPNTADLSNQI